MLVSICVANYKQDKFLPELMDSIAIQDYPYIETCVYYDKEGVGSGEAFNRAIAMAKGEIIVLMCADDVFTCKEVISDIVEAVNNYKSVGCVFRCYHQFIDGDRRPVRAWRSCSFIELANNPSGLAFRKEALAGKKLTNRMFVEAPALVADVLKDWGFGFLEYDTVAVRVHNSTARNKEYYLKRWTSSPVEEWVKLGGTSILNDFTSLIQIKNYFTMEGVLKECWNFIRLKPINAINPAFWFFSLIAILTPRFILIHVPHLYRITVGRWTTKVLCRPS